MSEADTQLCTDLPHFLPEKYSEQQLSSLEYLLKTKNWSLIIKSLRFKALLRFILCHMVRKIISKMHVVKASRFSAET